MNVERWSPMRDGELSEAALGKKLERLGYRVTRYIYPPGTSFPDHSHDVDKLDAVVSGKFRITLEGQKVILEAGDMLVVPCGVVHSAEVIGDEPVVSLDGVKSL